MFIGHKYDLQIKSIQQRLSSGGQGWYELFRRDHFGNDVACMRNVEKYISVTIYYIQYAPYTNLQSHNPRWEYMGISNQQQMKSIWPGRDKQSSLSPQKKVLRLMTSCQRVTCGVDYSKGHLSLITKNISFRNCLWRADLVSISSLLAEGRERPLGTKQQQNEGLDLKNQHGKSRVDGYLYYLQHGHYR